MDDVMVYVTESVKAMIKTADLLIWVVEGQSQHHISHLQLQLVTVGGSVIVYRFDLEEKEAVKPGGPISLSHVHGSEESRSTL